MVMAIFRLASVFLALLATLGGAKPVNTSTNLLAAADDKALLPRAAQEHCTNAPNLIAGTVSSKRSLIPDSSLHPQSVTRDPHTPLVATWCLLQSPVWVRIIPYQPVITRQIQFLLHNFAAIVQDRADHPPGNALVVPGYFNKAMYGYQIAVGTIPGQQMSWHVLEAGLYCLYEYMTKNAYTTCAFVIFDGAKMVGRGTLTPDGG